MMEFKIVPVLTAEQLMDKAFKKASKKKKRGANISETKKKTISVKLNTVAHTLEDTLKRYEEEFPTVDMLPPFYNTIIDIMLGTDKLKKSIGAVNWAKRRTKRILMEAARDLQPKEDPDEMEQLRKQAYGRVSSILRQVDDDLKFLGEARKKLNSLPDIRIDMPTVAVAGYPNVGKSLLVSKISSGKPKVAVYPFTTQEVGIGHFELKRHKCQLIDTPGILDRPGDERNDIEKQAVSALENLADLIIFIFDPTETCGYPMEDQKALANEIKDTFSQIQVIEVENKTDLEKTDTGKLSISALEGTNLEELLGLVKESLTFK